MELPSRPNLRRSREAVGQSTLHRPAPMRLLAGGPIFSSVGSASGSIHRRIFIYARVEPQGALNVIALIFCPFKLVRRRPPAGKAARHETNLLNVHRPQRRTPRHTPLICQTMLGGPQEQMPGLFSLAVICALRHEKVTHSRVRAGTNTHIDHPRVAEAGHPTTHQYSTWLS